MNLNFTKLCDIAKANGQADTAESYSALMESMSSGSIKKYAVLGDSNSGKSTVINAMTGEKSAPVSLISGKHDGILTVECRDKDYEFLEIASERYLDKGIKAYDNPLWHADAVIYIISALNPFTTNDVDSLKACVAKGIPCVLVLNKLEMVDDDDREPTLSSVKSQLYTTFGNEEIVLFDVKNPAQSGEKILKALLDCEESLDVREFTLTLELARELSGVVSKKYNSAKADYEEMKKSESDSEDEELFWEDIALEIDKRKIRLVNELDTAVFGMYNTCNSILSRKMNASPNPVYWWKTQLRGEMDNESRKISRSIVQMVETHAGGDKEWLSQSISNRFGINLKMEDFEASVNGADAYPTNIEPLLASTGESKKKAVGSLLASAAVLAGGILLPLSTIPTIIACSVGGVAVVGTGFWTYVESTGEKEQRGRVLKGELDKYVSQCRDSALEGIRNYIKYYYDNMLISAKDAQMIKMSRESVPTAEEAAALNNLEKLADGKKKVDEILSQMIMSDDDDEE